MTIVARFPFNELLTHIPDNILPQYDRDVSTFVNDLVKITEGSLEVTHYNRNDDNKNNILCVDRFYISTFDLDVDSKSERLAITYDSCIDKWKLFKSESGYVRSLHRQIADYYNQL